MVWTFRRATLLRFPTASGAVATGFCISSERLNHYLTWCVGGESKFGLWLASQAFTLSFLVNYFSLIPSEEGSPLSRFWSKESPSSWLWPEWHFGKQRILCLSSNFALLSVSSALSHLCFQPIISSFIGLLLSRVPPQAVSEWCPQHFPFSPPHSRTVYWDYQWPPCF